MKKVYFTLFLLLFCELSGAAFSNAEVTHINRWQPGDTERQTERDRMVDVLTSYRGNQAVTDHLVIKAMHSVPRHKFVPENARNRAYNDSPLAIGYGQTISQPYIVALMTQLADLKPGMSVLEIGTGSGYQAAVLNQLTDQVYTIEIIQPLAERTQRLFAKLKLTRINQREGDGYYGWPGNKQFDRILVTAAAAHIPAPLIKQLKPGGHMVIPVGPRWGPQELMLVLKDNNGNVRTQNILPVRFVPLTRGKD